MSKLFAMSKLRDAYELIKDGKHWGIGSYAQARDGLPVTPTSPEAERFCALGALAHALNIADAKLVVAFSDDAHVLQRVALELFDESVAHVNDCLGHAAVLQVYEKALVEAEGSL